MDIFSEKDLNKAIKDDLRRVAIEISDRLNSIVKNNVRKIVYDPYSPGTYKRKNWNNNVEEGTGGFWSSWVHDNVVWDSGENGFVSIIYSDSGRMDLDGQNYVHGNRDGKDRRAIMARAIAEGTDYDFAMERDEERLQEQISLFDSVKHKNYSQAKKDAREKKIREENEEKKGWWQNPRDYWTPSLESISGGLLDLATDMSFSKRNIQFIKI